VAESLERIDLRRAARRNVAGNQGDNEQEQGDRSKSRRIGRAHFEEQILQDAGQSERRAANPNVTPISVRLIPRQSTIRNTSPACAPRAIRTPISCVRLLTA